MVVIAVSVCFAKLVFLTYVLGVPPNGALVSIYLPMLPRLRYINLILSYINNRFLAIIK